MPQNAAGSSRVPNALVRAFALLVTAGALLFPRLSHAAPDPLNVLLVANGYYTQETQIEDHLLDLGYSVTRLKDYRLKGTTSLAPYDLIVISEFAPGIPTSGIDNLKTAGKPILIVEYWDFFYSYKLGLTTSSSCGYVGTDTITSIREGYDDFTSRVGAEALVYQPQYTVYGIDIANVKPNATPLYWSSASFEEVAVLVDYAKKIAVTGVYDTRKYTVDAWKMLDILLAQILPAPATYATMDEVAQAYVDSGLYTLAADIEADLKQDPQSWTFDEAELYAWQLVTGWGLGELWDYVMTQLGDIFDTTVDLPGAVLFYTPPERPHGTNPGYLPDVPPVEHEYWIMGEHWDPTGAVVHNSFRWADYLRGTDLGMSAELYGRRFFYMGDTWNPLSGDPQWSTVACPSPAKCNDMILVSQDDAPNDGIIASPILFSRADKWMPVVIPGVHKDFSTELPGSSYWTDTDNGAAYTVPSGVVTTILPAHAVHDGLSVMIPMRGVMLWYGTATAPYGSYEDANGNSCTEPLDGSDPRHRPTSWVGCSFNGINFYACYTEAAGTAVPFSIDASPYSLTPPGSPPDTDGGPSQYPGAPARFIHVAPVELTEADFAEACSENLASCLCDTDLFPVGTTSRSGLLLYGSGRPYRKSGLFLAFIKSEEIGLVDTDGKPVVHYWTFDTDSLTVEWSMSEVDATSLSGAPHCDNWVEPDWDCLEPSDTDRTGGCWPGLQGWDGSQVFGELSARLVRSTAPSVSSPSRIVLLNNNFAGVLAWTPYLATPADGFVDTDNYQILKTNGYGPYIIDGLGDTTYPGLSGDTDGIVLWHTISVWDGTQNTPYGVYTGSEVVTW